MHTLEYWLKSCSYDDPLFREVDMTISKWIAPYFTTELSFDRIEPFITTTIKLYKEVVFIKDSILGDQLNLNYISRNDFAVNVMTSWLDKYPHYSSIVQAVCYDINLEF